MLLVRLTLTFTLTHLAQVTHKYYWSVFRASLSAWRKMGLCYLFHLRWLLLIAAVLAAVINPVITPLLLTSHLHSRIA